MADEESTALDKRLSEALDGHIHQLIKHAIFMSELAASARKAQSPRLDTLLELRAQAKTVVDQAQRAREIHERSSHNDSSLKRVARDDLMSFSQSSERPSKRQRLSSGGTAGPPPAPLEQQYDEYQTEVLQRLEKLERLRAQRRTTVSGDTHAGDGDDQILETVRSQMSTLGHKPDDIAPSAINGKANAAPSHEPGRTEGDKQKRGKLKRTRESGGETSATSAKKGRKVDNS